MSLPLLSSPRGLLPQCSLHSDPYPPRVPCLGQLPPPRLQWLSLYEGGSAPSCPQWTDLPLWSSLPLHPTLASGLVCSVEFPHPTPRSTDSVDSSVCGEDAYCGWQLTPRTLLPVCSWEHFAAPSPSHGASCPWRLDSSHSEVSPPPCTQVPRTEHTPGYHFGLHISASPVPVVQFFCGLALPIPLQPCCTILTRHREEADVRCCPHCSLGSWGKELNPGWRGWEGC